MNTLLLLASVTAFTSTDNNFWRAGVAMESDAPSGEVLMTCTPEKAVIAPGGYPIVLKAWGTTFNERDLDALKMIPAEVRKDVIRRAFSPRGDLKFTRGRLTMNANDYSRAWYSCSEVEGDFENRHFNIEHDKTNSLVYVKWALKENPAMKFWVSPWSPPAWMKINKEYCVVSSPFNTQDPKKNALLYSGESDAIDPNEMWLQGQRGRPFPRRLATQNYFIQEPKYLASYAEQFCRFIDLYAQEGVTIDRVMYQNEAYSYAPYPGCPWTAEGTVRFNRDYLAPALRKHHPEVKLGIGTFNTNRKSYIEQILTADGMADCYDLIGFQWEGLDTAPDICRTVRKPFICSESECGNGSMDWKQGAHTFWLIEKNLRYGAIEWYNWNLILEDNGRSAWGWCQNALIQVDSKTKKIRYTPEYYAVKHYTHYIAPGARQIGAFEWNKEREGVAYRNPDGTLVVVIGNWSGADSSVSVKLGEKYLNATLPARSFNTFVVK
ncbi:MAG: glycoside hydrolase family 30 beta sandwich domain-containing protein [Kiritimatiellia bacterium]